MKTPRIQENVGRITYSWDDLKLKIIAERISTEGYAELRFISGNGDGETLLHMTRINLLASTTMTSLAKRLDDNSRTIPWTDVLTYVTGKTLEVARRGEPLIEIWPSEDDTLTPEYLLEPLLYRNHPTVLFGDYGSLKSISALMIAYVVQLPYMKNTFGLKTRAESTICLYLDYEDDPSSFRKRWSALGRGLKQGAMSIQYRRMTTTVSESVGELQQIIADGKVGLLIVDSLGPAARGNLNDPEPAIKYHTALRQLGITSLTLAHTSKDHLTKKRTIFGSVFFTNLARSVWECKSEQEAGEDEVTISIKHTKANLSRLHPPIGYTYSFTDNSISVNKIDLRDTRLSGELSLSVRIKDLLRRNTMTVKEIAEILEANEATVRTAIHRMADKSQLIKVGNSWGLSQ